MTTTEATIAHELVSRHIERDSDPDVFETIEGDVLDTLHHLAKTPDRLDPEFKRRWVEALRSGRYDQGTGYLRDHEDRYCCLGVLSDLVDPNWETGGHNHCYIHSGVVEAQTMPALTVYYQAVQNPDNLSLEHPLTMALTNLATLNDDGAGFGLIADLIEEHM